VDREHDDQPNCRLAVGVLAEEVKQALIDLLVRRE